MKSGLLLFTLFMGSLYGTEIIIHDEIVEISKYREELGKYDYVMMCGKRRGASISVYYDILDTSLGDSDDHRVRRRYADDRLTCNSKTRELFFDGVSCGNFANWVWQKTFKGPCKIKNSVEKIDERTFLLVTWLELPDA